MGVVISPLIRHLIVRVTKIRYMRTIYFMSDMVMKVFVLKDLFQKMVNQWRTHASNTNVMIKIYGLLLIIRKLNVNKIWYIHSVILAIWSVQAMKLYVNQNSNAEMVVL